MNLRPSDPFEDIPRGGHEVRADPPTAQFTRPEALFDSKQLGYEPGKIPMLCIGAEIEDRQMPLGRIDRHSHGGRMLAHADDRHGMVIAPTRGGKDRSFGRGFLHSYPGGIQALDFKGDMAACVAYREHHFKNRCVVIDPFRWSDVPEAHLGAFNPLDMCLNGVRFQIDNMKTIGEALVHDDLINEKYWQFSAQDLAAGIAGHIATYKKYEGRLNLITMRELIRRGTRWVEHGLSIEDAAASGATKRGIEGLLIEMKDNRACGDFIRDTAIQLQEKPPKEMGSILSTLRTATSWLDSPEMVSVLSHSTFSYADARNGDQPLDVFWVLPPSFLGTHIAWIRINLLFSLRAQMETKSTPAYRPYYLLNEYHLLGKLSLIEQSVALMAEYCSLVFMIQDLNQLADIHGSERWQSIWANCGWTLLLGSNDTFTLEQVSKKLGQTIVHMSSDTRITTDAETSGAQTHNTSLQITDLMHPFELNRFLDRSDAEMRCLLLIAGKDPILGPRMNFDSHEFFEDARVWINKYQSRK